MLFSCDLKTSNTGKFGLYGEIDSVFVGGYGLARYFFGSCRLANSVFVGGYGLARYFFGSCRLTKSA